MNSIHANVAVEHPAQLTDAHLGATAKMHHARADGSKLHEASLRERRQTKSAGVAPWDLLGRGSYLLSTTRHMSELPLIRPSWVRTGFAMMAARTGDFSRNSSRSNGEMHPVAEKVATTTWRDEPAPAYASRCGFGRAAIALAGSLKPIH